MAGNRRADEHVDGLKILLCLTSVLCLEGLVVEELPCRCLFGDCGVEEGAGCGVEDGAGGVVGGVLC